MAAAVAESEPEADPAAQVGFLPKILGTAPTPAADGAFTPSKYALSVGTVAKTDFDGGAYENPYNGGISDRPIENFYSSADADEQMICNYR